MQQESSFVNLNHAIIKKSLKRVDSNCFSVGVLDFTNSLADQIGHTVVLWMAW